MASKRQREKQRARRQRRRITAAEKTSAARKPIKTTGGDVRIQAAADDKSSPTFDVVAYTGAAMDVSGWEHPIVLDLSGMTFGKSIVANLDHDETRRVGHVTSRSVEGGELRLQGVASAATAHQAEVVNSAKNGFAWQASVEVYPRTLEDVAAGESVDVNGKTINGPVHVVRAGKLTGFAFVSHGADENTTAAIAAQAGRKKKGKPMKISDDVRAFIAAAMPEADVQSMTDDEIENLKLDFAGSSKPRKKITGSFSDTMDDFQKEQARQNEITECAVKLMERNPHHTEQIRATAETAISEKWPVNDFRLKCYDGMNSLTPVGPNFGGRSAKLDGRVLEAAVAQVGRLKNIDKHYSDQELQLAHDRFRSGIGLKQLLVIAAEANGYRSHGYQVDVALQRAAFGLDRPGVQAGISSLSLPTLLSNIANKFLMMGWMAVDQTALRIARIRSVNNFHTQTTISLVGDHQFDKVPRGGSLEHGEETERTYTNKADTYGKLFGIDRQDLINDDIDALTSTPRRIGRGGMLKLNDLFWTEFLDNAAFFAAGNNNVITGATSALSLGGLQLAEAKFMNQTDPAGKPLGLMPAILLAPPSLAATARELHQSTRKITGEDATFGDANVFEGKYRPETSPYMENASYTGNSAAAWYLLADPQDLPVIEIVALGGRVEPVVETADAEFNVLGIQMRGYSDVGTAKQEYLGGVRAAGS